MLYVFFGYTEEICSAYAVRKNTQLVRHEKQNTILAYSRSRHDRLPRPASKTLKTKWTSTRNSKINDLLSWPHKTNTHTHELHADYEQLQMKARDTLSSSFLERSKYLHLYIYTYMHVFHFHYNSRTNYPYIYEYTYIYIYIYITVEIYIHQCNKQTTLTRHQAQHSKVLLRKRESCLKIQRELHNARGLSQRVHPSLSTSS